MHINFDDEGAIINNIQLFLKENQNINLNLSGVWDTETHETLIQYLKRPNTDSVYEAKEKILNKFTFRSTLPPHSLVDGGGIVNFDTQITPSSILFYTKPTIKSYDNGVLFISEHIEELNSFAKTFGWSVTSHTSYGTGEDVSGRLRAEILVEQTGLTNYFPNKEVLPMVNLVSGKYLYNWAFAGSDNSFVGHMSPDNNYKVAVIPCKAGDTFTITHGYSMPCEMAFAYTNRTLVELKEGGSVESVVSRLEGSIKGSVPSGTWDYYEVPQTAEDVKYLLVQMPYRDDLTSYQSETVRVLLGDVNCDGVVDMSDYNLLNAWVLAKENNQTPPIELTGNALIAANVTKDVDIEGNPIIDRNDATVLLKAITENKVEQLGAYEYQKSSRVSAHEMDRLLVMSGEYAMEDELNIPTDQFWIAPWAVHSKFIEYFLGRVIHKYSDMEDIAWLQENIRHMYAIYESTNIGTYDGPENFAARESIKYDAISGRYKYYENGLYSGYVVVSDDNLFSGKFVNETTQEVAAVYIEQRRLYKQGTYLERIILADGTIVTSNCDNSLKSLVKRFQLFTNKQLEANGVASSDRIKWTYGNYCVDTDNNFVRSLSSGITYKTGAFR